MEVGAEDDLMVTCELEAAAALAGLARCPGELKRQLVTEPVYASTRHSKEDQSIGSPQLCDYASRIEEIVEDIPRQLCSTSGQSNPVSKLRPKPTEAEKEARKLRRVLANRESARQTIRRRHAMHLELTRKASDLLEENENLKKGKEVAVEKYNSLRDRNEILKVQLGKLKKAEAGGKQEEPNTSQAEKSCSACSTTPIFLHNQPSIVPCIWPSIFPSSDVLQIHCAADSNDKCLSQFHIANKDLSCSQKGQQNFMGIARSGAPYVVLPVPWLLPFLTHSNTVHSHSDSNDRLNTNRSCTCSCSGIRLHEGNNQMYSNLTEASNSRKPMSVCVVSAHGAEFTSPDTGGQHTENHPNSNMVVPGLFRDESTMTNRIRQVDNTSSANVVAALESTRHGLSDKKTEETIICPLGKSEDVSAATVARKRRKELMKLKNKNCYRLRTWL